jgi:acetoin utilization deacetylase AcuC-like enzyme
MFWRIRTRKLGRAHGSRPQEDTVTIVYRSELFRRHETGSHPETPKRLAAIDRVLGDSPSLKLCELGEPRPISPEDLALIHEGDVVARAREMSQTGGGYLDPDTVVSSESFDVALAAAGTAVCAVDEVMTGRHENALCLIRPPGHHATKNRSMGFCLFNNVALAARQAQRKHGAGRILIVDWDVHHGNGTQDIFYDSDDVVFFSIHRFPFYPGTGTASETGTGKGLGATVNVPVTFGTSRERYLDLFQKGLEQAAAKAKPDLVLISAGFDAHAEDPVGNLGLNSSDYGELTRRVREVARTYCSGRIVSCLEGGYNLEALGESVSHHLEELVSANPYKLA